MKSELKWMIYCMALGAGLVVYAHGNFASKETVKDMHGLIKTMDARIYDMHRLHGLRDKKK